MKVLTIDEIDARLLEKHGTNIEVLDYARDDFKKLPQFRCTKCGYIWKTEYFSVLNAGTGCKACASKVKGEKCRITEDEAQKRLVEKTGNTVIMTNYIKMGARANFECKICGNRWLTTPNEVINGNSGCPKCVFERIGENKRLNYLEVKAHLKNSGCDLLSDNYKRNTEKLEIKYPCGHINKISLAQFNYGFGCKKCREATFYKNRYPEDALIEFVEGFGFNFMGFVDEYKDGSSHILYKCGENHITERAVKYFIRFPTCKKCKIIGRGIMQSGSGGPSWKGGVSKIWVAARARLDSWTTASYQSGSGICCITGEKDVPIDVHHLRSFNLIAEQALEEFGFLYDRSDCLMDLGEENISPILKRIVELHWYYGTGVCVRRDLHILYHVEYGHGNNTPEQFEEFKQKIASGEIIIPN